MRVKRDHVRADAWPGRPRWPEGRLAPDLWDTDTRRGRVALQRGLDRWAEVCVSLAEGADWRLRGAAGVRRVPPRAAPAPCSRWASGASENAGAG